MKTIERNYPSTRPDVKPDGTPTDDMFQLTETCINEFEYSGVRLPDMRDRFTVITSTQIGKNRYRMKVTAYKGYRFDGASVPRIAWWIGHPMTPRFQRAALIHDIFYGFRVNRRQADWLFNDLLQEDGVNEIRANVMCAAVRVGGWFHYNS